MVATYRVRNIAVLVWQCHGALQTRQGQTQDPDATPDDQSITVQLLLPPEARTVHTDRRYEPQKQRNNEASTKSRLAAGCTASPVRQGMLHM